MKTLFYIILIVSAPVFSNAEVIFEDNFDGYADSPLNNGWTHMGDDVFTTDTGGYNSTRGIQIVYDHQGYWEFALNKSVSNLSLQEVYVRFYFKVDDPNGGSKFMKYFGINDADNYANSTFILSYTGTTVYEVSYGPGDILTNDTQAVIKLDGSSTTDPLVNVITANGAIETDDGLWHCFETYMRYNSDDTRDGEYKVWFDGALILHADNVKNRHNDNSLFFGRIELGGYTHTTWDRTWNLWYDDVVISDSYIGPLGNTGQTKTGTGQFKSGTGSLQ